MTTQAGFIALMSENEDFYYRCGDESDLECATSCTGVDECEACSCVIIQEDGSGPWGDFMDFLFCLLPIIFLVAVTVKPNPMKTTISLPMAAFFMYLIRLMYFGSDPTLTNGAVILGLHEAITPLSIMAGAITLFESMEATYCMPYMIREMKALTQGHPVADSMLIFCFAYMVEGASGFGTPVALGAPMLVSSGHEKLESIVLLLLMNTFATVWGAVGTPIWFGFSDVVDDEEDFFEISYKAAIALCVGAFILMPFILTILVPWKVVKQNLMFITCSLLTVVGPSLALSFFSYEFPALLGGMIGCGGTAVLIGRKVGLTTVNPDDLSSLGMMDSNSDSGTPKQMVDDGSAKDQVDERAKEKPNDEAPSSDANETGDDREGGEKHSVDNGDDNQDGSRTKQVEDSANEGHQEGGEKPTSENGNHNQDGSKTEISADYGAKKGDKKDDDGNAESEEEDRKVNDEEGTEVVIDSKTAKVTSSLSKKASAGAAPSLTQSKLSGTVPALQDDVEAHLGPRDKEGFAYVKEMLLRTFPIWSVVLLLILTRVEVFGLKELLTLTEPSFSINFGTYGIFKLSASLVFQLVQIMTFPGLDWKYEFLYIPFFIPFVVVSLTTLFIFRKDSKSSVGEIAKTVGGRLASPVFALMGALTLVQLMIETDTVAPAYILGSILSDWFKEAFVIISPLLGALGSFFSGSTTVSNKTFGQIQAIAAENIGTSVTTMLALQSVGASAGNGICLNNIISACTVVGLTIGEGQILMRTYKYVFINTTIATAVMLAFFFRFD